MIADPKASFFFFYHFVHRHNISLDSSFDSLQTNYQNMLGHSNFSVDKRFIPYFQLFDKYYTSIASPQYLFWIICVLYYIPLHAMQRFITFLMVEMQKVISTTPIIPYDKVRSMSKLELVECLQTFVNQGQMQLQIALQAIFHFF